MTDQLRLNLGCADRYVPGWVNVDWEHNPHRKDQTVDLTSMSLPWVPGTVTHAYLGHLLEHLEPDQCYRLLANLFQIMRKGNGAEIMIVGPDMLVVRQMVMAGVLDTTYHTLESLAHGGKRWPGDEHKWESTAGDICDLLWRTGWRGVTRLPVSEVGPVWPVADRGQPWQYFVRAYAGPMTGFPGKKAPSREA